MRHKRNLFGKTALLLAVVLTLFGCGGNTAKTAEDTADEEQTAEKEQTAEQGQTEDASLDQTEPEESASADDSALADELKKKYSAAEKNEYDGNVIKVKRNQAVELKLGYDLWASDASPYDSFVIYQDAELKYPVEAGGMDFDSSTGTLAIEPPFAGVAEIMDSDGVDLSHLTGNYLSGDEESGWGTLSQYYLKSSVNLETGEPLSTPVITVIKVEAEIPQAPQLVFDQLEDGYARFSWKAVPGAEGYLLFRINKDEEGLWNYCYAFADVKGTEWTSEGDVNEFEGKILSLNYDFEQYFTSEDLSEWMEGEDGSFLKEFAADDTAYNEYWDEYYGVIAYKAGGCSPISNLLSAMDISHMLPAERANLSNDIFFDINGVLDLPAIMNVTMCDGSRAQKVLLYDFDNYEKDEEYNVIRINAKALQTPFTEELSIYEVNWDTLDADLEAIKKRQEELINKGGNVAPSLTIDEGAPSKSEETETPKAESSQTESSKTESAQEQEQPEQTEESKAEQPKEDKTQPSQSGRKEVKVTANSAMSEYIALNMLETKGEIRLSDFPESADVEQVVDAFFEAQYQNPLVLGVQGGSIDTEKRILYVEYDFPRQVTAVKQQEIQKRVDEITGEIISDGMSDVEKEMAINTWLCENAVYDDGALENAEKYSFTQVDEDFYDSFTAYGILTEGVGVCASYSASFKLLADAADLESIVVTGYLDGSVPHAWNKVKLDDNWYIVDATNNDNDTIENALLNLSDRAAYGTLVENENFVMDGSLGNYRAREDEQEYYRVTDRFFDTDAIADELAELLVSDGKAVLRTDYDIDDETFYGIAQQAADKAHKNINGFYWMGVIRLEE
ncbi:MAG: hypothetical protein NC429_05955 [Lachnospiraceae bacterium]|nr:hypothetical protein [Lachnospiraceae bacterium]